ncbi:MAG: PAS domain-containing protein [Spirochaetes bacterium]|nr:PAS domain-containing protein [Spirochaetota bacterium]
MIKSNFLSSFQKKIDKFDIGTIKNFLYELIEENENLRTVFNSMKEAVLVLDKNMNVTFYNKMSLRIFEINVKNPIGIHISDILNNKYFLDIITTSIKKEEIINDYEIMLDSNNPKYISFSLYPLAKEGKIIGNIIILNDITLEKENKNKLRQAESLAALTTISAGIAHEIKNPLGAISIHIQLLEQELDKYKQGFSKDFKYSIEVIKEEIERLNNIVVDFLITVRPLKAELMLTNLNIFLDKFVNFITPELESKNIIIRRNFSDLPDVWLDEKYFKQALLNLIKNSIASIKENGIIEIEAYQKQNYLFLNIIDNGSGITEEIQPKVFNPYFTTKNTGTGLGLTIVYKIVKEHKGEISFSSKKGETIFTIKLPLSYIKEGLIEYSGD